MSDLLREMCVEYESGAHRSNEDAMRAALLWLASNVSDEMVFHLIGDTFKHRPPAFKFEHTVEQTRSAIAAALRAAAGGGEK